MIGSSIVAVVIGTKILHDKESRLLSFKRIATKRLDVYITCSMFLITFVVLGISLYQIHAANINLNPLPNSTSIEHFDQVGSVAARIPYNGSLATQGSLFSEVYQRPNVELLGNYYYFQPKYILIDTMTITKSEYRFFENFTKAYNYSLYAQNGTVSAYVERG